ncbi:MAG: bifunctional precorrin-2 dehydrogenase/sirohydrochlorin ferrochelatase [Candidatus Omnitrophica bacterium]|nr:bifunctional precorrin-2 dehydrogenase/sirohydrochlorin ferrochelatase [Candidatus Omnitrophota bacterium]
MMIKYYPVNLALRNKKCVVIGAGQVAFRKAKRILEYGGRVWVIGEKIAPQLRRLVEKKGIVFKNKRADLKDLCGAFLVIAATGDRKLNARICAYCLRKNILVNVVDSPKDCNFILPSVLRRGSLTISVSTNGVSPALAKKIRQDIQQRFGSEYAKLLRLMKDIRPQALKEIKNPRIRNLLFKRMLQPEILSLLKKNKEQKARKRIKKGLKILLGAKGVMSKKEGVGWI